MISTARKAYVIETMPSKCLAPSGPTKSCVTVRCKFSFIETRRIAGKCRSEAGPAIAASVVFGSLFGQAKGALEQLDDLIGVEHQACIPRPGRVHKENISIDPCHFGVAGHMMLQHMIDQSFLLPQNGFRFDSYVVWQIAECEFCARKYALNYVYRNNSRIALQNSQKLLIRDSYLRGLNRHVIAHISSTFT